MRRVLRRIGNTLIRKGAATAARAAVMTTPVKGGSEQIDSPSHIIPVPLATIVFNIVKYD